MTFQTIYEFFKTALLENQFAQGGFAIAALTGIFMFGRRMLSAMWTWVLRKTTMRIEILGDDNAFNWIQLWLANSRFGKKTQTLMLRNDNKGSCTLVPGEGKHFFFYKKRLVYLWNIVEPMKFGGVDIGYRRSTVLQIIPGSRRIGEEFIREAETYFNNYNRQMVTIHTSDMWGNNWRASNLTYKRPLESVILPGATKQMLREDIAEFKGSKDRYRELNIPWRRGYLLHGEPGNGKTSLALAIASEFDYPLYALQVSTMRDDEKLRVLCDSLPENAVLLMEDIDCTTVAEERDGETESEASSYTRCRVTLSGLLNALDGVTSSEGRIVIMTTNHPERLDAALVRAGRADKHVEISTPVPEQAVALFERFYGKSALAEQFAGSLNYASLNMATLQVFFLGHKTAEQAMAHRFDLLPQPDKAVAEAWSS